MASLSDYYRQRQSQPSQPEAPAPEPAEPAGQAELDTRPFQLTLPDGWRDQTLHVFAGPLEEGHQHTVTVAADPEAGEEGGLDGFADRQIGALEAQLKGFEVVAREAVALRDGTPAVRAVFSWRPAEGSHLVQEQLYVLHASTGYTLTATFSPATFETRGREIGALLLSFVPS